jgi:hypothetical protein
MSELMRAIAALMYLLIGVIAIPVGVMRYWQGAPVTEWLLIFTFAGVALNRADLYVIRERVGA